MRGATSLLLACALLGAGSARGAEGAEELPGVGAEAPPFALPVYNAEAAKVARTGTMMLVGDDAEDPGTRLIVISFMASHCKPCKRELPFLQQLSAKYASGGLRVVGVAIDNEPEGQKAMAGLLQQLQITFPVAKDGYNFTARRYLGDQVPLPSVFLVNRQGAVTFVSRGYSEQVSKKLVEEIQKGLGVALEPIPLPAATELAEGAAPAAQTEPSGPKPENPPAAGPKKASKKKGTRAQKQEAR